MAGYEKLAGLMTKHAEVATFQRFDFLNILNILYFQSELVHLEQELRESIGDDLKSGNSPVSEFADESGSLSDSRGEEDIESADTDNSRAEDVMEKRTVSQMETKSVSKADCETNERVESARDWYFLANMENSPTWDIMLRAREKLKEYSWTHLESNVKIAFSDNVVDEAVLQYTEMKTQDSPNSCDVEFLRRWFKDKNMGDFPLIGRDSTLWESSMPSDLIALKARKAEDPLGSLFLSRVFLWWHNCIGHRIKKPLDEEAQYFEYRDENVLRVANIFGSIISSGLLVGSILALYFVDNILVRLGIVAAFTQVFSLVLVLVTSARNVEVFAATAA